LTYILNNDSGQNWNTFTPTVTKSAGGTVPVYSTNTGRYRTFGNLCFVDVYLTGDGGSEGVGGGFISVALPVPQGESFLNAGDVQVGYALNGGNEMILVGTVDNETVTLSFLQTITNLGNFGGNEQDNATRTIRLKFAYEI